MGSQIWEDKRGRPGKCQELGVWISALTSSSESVDPTGLAWNSSASGLLGLSPKAPRPVFLLAFPLPCQALLASAAKESSLPNQAAWQGWGLERGYGKKWAAGGGVAFCLRPLSSQHQWGWV